MKILPGGGEYVTTINSINFDNTFPEMSMNIPRELIQMFANNRSGNGTGGVRTVAFLFYEVEHLFPNE